MASLIVRNSVFYIQYMASGKAKRVSTGTESLQIAKEKLRQFESAQANGNDNPLPTRTPIDAVVTAYVSHIRNVKTAKSAQTDIYYLRDAYHMYQHVVLVNSGQFGGSSVQAPYVKHFIKNRVHAHGSDQVVISICEMQLLDFRHGKVLAGDLERKTPPAGFSRGKP